MHIACLDGFHQIPDEPAIEPFERRTGER